MYMYKKMMHKFYFYFVAGLMQQHDRDIASSCEAKEVCLGKFLTEIGVPPPPPSIRDPGMSVREAREALFKCIKVNIHLFLVNIHLIYTYFNTLINIHLLHLG